MSRPKTEAERLEIAGKRRMSDSERWQAVALKNISEADLMKANANFEEMKRRWPSEAAPVVEMLDRTGVGNHPSVIEHFIRTPAVPDSRALSQLLMFPTATGVPHGKDQVGVDAKLFKEQS